MMKRIFILLLIVCFYRAGAQPVNFYIAADADDWQLFMSGKVVSDLGSGAKAVFIILTAGDEGNSTGTFNGSSVAYYMARENGAVNSAKFAWDMLQTNPNTGPVPTVQTSTINSHLIKKYVYNNTVTYFLRLPDGNSNGSGYVNNSNKSLRKLYGNIIPSIAAIDGSTTYTGWADLTTTIRTIINTERGLNVQVWLNAISLDSTNANTNLNNSADHSDHYYSSKAAQDAVSGLLWVGINQFIGNRSGSLTANLTNPEFQNASVLFSVSDWPLAINKYATRFTGTNKALLPMDYFSINRSPVGTPLAVTLIDISGKLQRNDVLLEWNTLAEYNSKAFEIERSVDGINYQKLAGLPAAGNSNSLKTYHYLDITATELNYYRLRMVDIDGNYKYSSTIVIKNPGLQQDVFVINDPFTHNIGIRFAKIPVGKIRTSLTDMSGKLIGINNYNQQPASILYFDNYSNVLSKGVYILHIEAEGKSYNLKLIKQ
jgi:hypothetical protein